MEVNEKLFREVMAHLPTGVTIATTSLNGRSYGMTVSAFCSLSLDPLLILVCIDRSALMHDLVTRSHRYAVNILGEESDALSRYFATSQRDNTVLGFEDIGHHPAVTGSPILDAAVGYLDCTVETIYPGGDHTIFVGRVVALGVTEGARPLLYWRGRYGRFASTQD